MNSPPAAARTANRTKSAALDAVVVGAGPNGLAAAITLAQAGQKVLVIEGHANIGGGTRTAELTLPGFRHDVCSAIHPLGVASPIFRDLPLEQYGLEWIFPPLAAAHPLDDGTAVIFDRSIETTAASMGSDADRYRRLIAPIVRDCDKILADFLYRIPIPPHHPLAALRFGVQALFPASLLARLAFRGERARAAFAGMAAHSMLPLSAIPSASFGLLLAMLTHAVGWPMARGGSQAITRAMAAYLQDLGGEIITGQPVSDWAQLPQARNVLLNLSPRSILNLAADRLPGGYRRALQDYRYGPGIFKVDWALDGPVPWTADDCARAGTVHLGGTMEEISASEQAVWRGEHAERPFVLVTQTSPFDPSRAPQGKHTLWAYCHVPSGSTQDMTGVIEDQIERFAPGFRDRILARHTYNSRELEAYNPNYVGGDINSGVQDLLQFFSRPVLRLDPYSTPLKGVYICSSATPPGGGVHGICGYNAARSALKRQ